MISSQCWSFLARFAVRRGALLFLAVSWPLHAGNRKPRLHIVGVETDGSWVEFIAPELALPESAQDRYFRAVGRLCGHLFRRQKASGLQVGMCGLTVAFRFCCWRIYSHLHEQIHQTSLPMCDSFCRLQCGHNFLLPHLIMPPVQVQGFFIMLLVKRSVSCISITSSIKCRLTPA